MGAKPVMMSGVMYPLNKMQPPVAVSFVGNAWDPGLEVGGGPIVGGEPPLGIWGPPGPWPTPPIYIPPGAGGQPPGIWGPPGPWPTPPIHIPPQQPPSAGPPGTPTFPIWGPPGIELPPGSGYPPVAGHPLPPEGGEPPKPIVGWEAKPVWTPESGWAVVIVPKPGTEVPTPSK